MRSTQVAAALAALLALPSPAALAGPWHEAEGARLRLVVEEAPAGEPMRAALEIELADGWKTYWRDPIDSGVPPGIVVRGMQAEFDFPAPLWLSDGYSTYAGYDRPVSLPLTLTPAASLTGPVEAEIFVGVCETICIPVQTVLTAEPAAAGSAEADAVDAAFAALPERASETFGVRVVGTEIDAFTVEADLPEGSGEPALFVASSPHHATGRPERVETGDGTVRFRVPVEGLSARIVEADLSYTLVSDDRAASGTITVSY